jgi:hypothetical protein
MVAPFLENRPKILRAILQGVLQEVVGFMPFAFKEIGPQLTNDTVKVLRSGVLRLFEKKQPVPFNQDIKFLDVVIWAKSNGFYVVDNNNQETSYFSLSLRSFHISHRALPTDALILPVWNP